MKKEPLIPKTCSRYIDLNGYRGINNVDELFRKTNFISKRVIEKNGRRPDFSYMTIERQMCKIWSTLYNKPR